MLSLGIGYAFLTTTLSIEGTSDIDSANWNVYFDNLTISVDSNLPSEQIYTPATISVDGKTITYSIKLKELNDNYAFNVEVVNDGTIDAKLNDSSFLINGNPVSTVPNYLSLMYIYSDYNELDADQVLLAGESVNLYYSIGYNSALRPEDLPNEDMSLNISISIDYAQTSIGKVLYAENRRSVVLGEKLTSGNRYYEDYNEFVNTNHYVFNKYILDDNHIITESYIGIIKDGEVYYLRCGKSTFNSSTNDYNNDSPYYEANKDILISIFGASNCHDYDNGDGYQCIYNNRLMYTIKKNGYMLITAYGYGSEFLPDGSLFKVIVAN